MDDRPLYSHSETGTLMLATMAGALLISLGVAVLGTVTAKISYPWAFPALFLFIGLNFYRLEVSVYADRVTARLGAGLIRRTIPLSAVASAEISKGAWYGGWGLRWTGRGWFWTVNSLDAVVLNFKDGGEFLLGTDEPQALLEAVRAALGRA